MTRPPAFTDIVAAQIDLLRAGRPLAAFDAFFADDVVMIANDVLFASGKAEGRAKQEPFISAATAINGRISDVHVVAVAEICVFRNRTSFTDTRGLENQIDGLSWQKWRDGRVVLERYYDGALMQAWLAKGVLDQPGLLAAL